MSAALRSPASSSASQLFLIAPAQNPLDGPRVAGKECHEGVPMRVLLVEDNEKDVILIREAMADASLDWELHHVPDGDEALRFLRLEGEFASEQLPDFLLVDLNMPKRDGFGLMEELCKDDGLRHLVVVAFTTSCSDRDVLRMYRLRCNSFVPKPFGYHEFLKLLADLDHYWREVAVLPSSPAPLDLPPSP